MAKAVEDPLLAKDVVCCDEIADQGGIGARIL
jgi:hypothetical protein